MATTTDDVVHARCAGIDLSKKDAKVCVRVLPEGKRRVHNEITTYLARTGEVARLREYLISQQVTCVVMEATSDYWRIFYYGLQDAGFELILANPQHVRQMRGRKTDVNDATWLAKLGALGTVRGSFVPPTPIRDLRALTRRRRTLVQSATAEQARLEKLLEDTGIKLGAVSSKLMTKSGLAIIQALAAGAHNPNELADLGQSLHTERQELIEALTGSLRPRHQFMISSALTLLEQITLQTDAINQQINAVMEPFAWAQKLLDTIPGIGPTTAQDIIGEIGVDMTVFDTPAHLTSWAGVCPGSNESAGKIKSTKTRNGNKHLRAALGIAVSSAVRSPDTFLAARFHRQVSHLGKPKAYVSCQRAMLTSIWHVLNNRTPYQDLGADFYLKRNPKRVINQATRKLKTLGFTVTLTPTN